MEPGEASQRGGTAPSSPRSLSRVRVLLAALFAGGLACACGTPQPGVLRLPEPVHSEAVSRGPGTALRIERITDDRQFADRHAGDDRPSLWIGDPGDTEITSRTVGRNIRGRRLGDVRLPEDQTVESVVADALRQALEENGYRVLDEDDAGYPSALPVEAHIREFWVWFRQGFWSSSFQFHSEIEVTAPIPTFEEGRVIRTDARKVAMWRGPAVLGGWRDTFVVGLGQLTEDTRAAVEEGVITGDVAAPPRHAAGPE